MRLAFLSSLILEATKKDFINHMPSRKVLSFKQFSIRLKPSHVAHQKHLILKRRSLSEENMMTYIQIYLPSETTPMKKMVSVIHIKLSYNTSNITSDPPFGKPIFRRRICHKHNISRRGLVVTPQKAPVRLRIISNPILISTLDNTLPFTTYLFSTYQLATSFLLSII